MRALRSPAAAPRFALALLAAAAAAAAAAVAGCAAPRHPAAPRTAAPPAAATVTPGTAGPAPPAGSGERLTAIAFVSAADGYGTFTRQAGGRCQALAGRTADGGARFGALTPLASWPCGGSAPAASLAADGHGDVFWYGPGLYASHDGGQSWTAARQPGVVLAVAAIGRSAWLLLADCRRPAGTCSLALAESADGGRTWAPAPAGPPGATVRAAGGRPALQVAGQTWLLRTGRSSGYVLSGPAGDDAPMWFTADAGTAWSRRQVPCGRIGAVSATLAAAPGGALLAVCAGQPGAGFQAKSAARSANGGRSWTVHVPCPPPAIVCHRGLPLDFGYLGQAAAVSARTLFLAGERSSLLVSTDGGARWQAVRPLVGDTSGGTSQVIFVSRRDGFVLGNDPRNGELPTIWRTTDGGVRWSREVTRP